MKLLKKKQMKLTQTAEFQSQEMKLFTSLVVSIAKILIQEIKNSKNQSGFMNAGTNLLLLRNSQLFVKRSLTCTNLQLKNWKGMKYKSLQLNKEW